jgi:hypothetical protein
MYRYGRDMLGGSHALRNVGLAAAAAVLASKLIMKSYNPLSFLALLPSGKTFTPGAKNPAIDVIVTSPNAALGGRAPAPGDVGKPVEVAVVAAGTLNQLVPNMMATLQALDSTGAQANVTFASDTTLSTGPTSFEILNGGTPILARVAGH